MNLDVFKGYEYDRQEQDEEIILSELPLTIITDSIRQQFLDPMEYGKNDFVESFETRYGVTLDQKDEENEEEIQKLYDQFMVFMRDIFQEKLSIGFPYLEDMPEHDQLQLIHYAYRFFIINLKKNAHNYVYNYIKEHREELAEKLPKRRDVSTMALQSVIDDEIDMTIITSISQCVSLVLEDEVNVETYMRYAKGEEADLENEFIDEKYDDFNITGNFVRQYLDMVDETTKIEIECQIRNELLSKYRDKMQKLMEERKKNEKSTGEDEDSPEE